MALEGDLASVDLAQVFQVLTQNQKDGVLELYRGGKHQGVRFRRGAVTLQFDRDEYEERTIELFRRLGRISEEKLHLAAANRAGSDAALIDVLVEMKILADGDVLVLFRERMAEELYDLFSWNEGRFEFHEGAERLEGAPGAMDSRLFFPADALVMEAARRVDEWTQIRQRVRDTGIVYAPIVDEFVPEDDLQAAIFSQIDGARSVEETIIQVGRSQFEVNKTLSRLVDLGVIAEVGAQQYPERGRQARAAGRSREAAHLYDLAANAQIEWPISLGVAAECWEEAGELALASNRYVAYGDALCESTDTMGALRAYCRARTLVPTHLEAWKKAVLLSLQFEERGETAEQAPAPLALAEILIDLDQNEIGVEVLERYVNCHPRDLAAKRVLSQALERTGNRKRQCELLESIANNLIQLGDSIGAAAALQTAFRLQPERKDISAKIRELYKRDERKRTNLKVVSTIIVLFAITGAVGFYFYARNERATAELAAFDIDGAIRVGDFDRARNTLETFKLNNKFTFSIEEADLLLERVKLAQLEMQGKEQLRKDEELAVRNRRMREAAALANGANAKVNEGKLYEALADLRKALAAAPPDWELAESSKQNVADLDRYLTKAAELGAKYVDQVEGRDFASARATASLLFEKYIHSPEGKNIKFPVEIESDPPGAEISIDGNLYLDSDGGSIRTPAFVFVAPGAAEKTIQLSRAGFTPGKVSLDSARDAKVSARLGRAADHTIQLPAAPTAPPAVYESIIYVPLAGAKLAAYSGSNELKWIVSVASAGEIQYAPHADHHGILVVTNDGVVANLSHDDGHMLWHQSYGSATRVAPAICNNGFLLGSDDGRIRHIQRETGNVIRDWKPAVKGIVALAVSSPILAAGFADGRIQLFDMNNQRTDERILNFGAPVYGMLIVDDVLIAAGDDGRISGFNWTNSKLLWDSPGGRIASPRPVMIGERILVDRAGKMTSLDPHTGKQLAIAADEFEAIGVPGRVSDQIIVGLRNGMVVSLKISDLSVQWQWPGAAGGTLNEKSEAKKSTPAHLIPTIATAGETCVVVADGKIFQFNNR
ncbi:MAG: DUF4388 domain-containing protein [Planctomycetota bacterium]